VAPAAEAKKRTVTSELKRLAAKGQIAPEIAAADRAIYRDAKKQRRKLSGTRARELGGVIADLDDMAARRQLTPSRLNPLFLTLQRNVEWWTTQRLLSSGERVSFPDSQLVWQLYPGHGLQIQWLGTFGKLNALYKQGKRSDAAGGALLDEVKGLASQRAGGLAWEYLFPFDGQKPPWVSSLAQGTGLQSMAREATRLKRQAEIFPIVTAGLGIFKTAPPTGVRIADGDGSHYLQYSGLPKLKIINGFIQSLVGLYDVADLTGDPTAQELFQAGDVAGREEIGAFNTGAWSLYSRGSVSYESNLNYHTLLRDFLVQLCKRTAAEEYCGAAQDFTDDLTTPPAIDVRKSTIRLHTTGTVRFKLSKISRVSIRISKGDKLIATLYPGTLSYGSKRVAWRAPKHSGDYDVAITATDLAGNTATAAGVVTVKKRK
jgi:hypothetical protein